MKSVKAKVFLEPYHYASRANALGRHRRKKDMSVESYFEKHFKRPVTVTPNGRTAISSILSYLSLKRDDEIYITTTFEKPNVSSCVTSTIFNFCKPSRVLTDKTRAIFVIHEFGVPHPRIEDLVMLARERRIPLIEDCAHTIDSKHNAKLVGRNGDYAICSFAKIFPVRHGGLLIGENITYRPTPVQAQIIDEVRRILPKYMRSINRYSNKKRANFRSLTARFEKISLQPLHEVDEEISPSLFFPLVTDKFEEVLEKASRSGIECALWHGANIVVFPGHQFLEEKDLERIFRVVKSVYEKSPR